MLPIKLVIVKFIAGARGDFVAGWLGKLPNFIESHWSFNPVTGQTISTNQHSLNLDTNTDLDNFLQSHRYVLDPSSNVFYATGVKNISPYYDSILTSDVAQILSIDSNNVNPNCLTWESIIKVFGRFTVNHNPQYYIDTMIKNTNITNQDRIDCLNNMLSNASALYHNSTSTQSGLDYNKLFQPGGSYIITDSLGINVDTKYHDYWNYMLPLACTPDEVTLWGHKFCYQDYFTD